MVLLTRAERTCVLVADELNHRIQVVDRDGAFIGFFGMHALVPRQGEGRVHYPVGLALSPDATALAVAEAFEDRVQILALTDVPPEPDPALGSLTEVSSHFGAESAGGGDLYFAVDVETESIVVFAADRTPPIHIATIGGSGALPRRFGEVSAIALEPANPRIWVADRGRRRIDCFDIVRDPAAQLGLDQFIPRLAVSFDLAALSSRLPVEEDVAAWRVPEVVDIAFVPGAEGQTEVVLLDRANRALLRAGTRLENPRVEMLPSGPDGARRPEEIAIDGSVVFVTDPVARCVFRRDADGAWQRLDALGGEPFVRPAGVAVPWPGCVVVTDTARDCCIVHCDGDSQVIGERGGLDEQFYQPESIAATAFGWIVVDRGNHRFQRFATPAPGRFEWNLTGGLGRWFDRKRRGSPGGALRPGGDA